MNHITGMKNYRDYRQFQFFDSVKKFWKLDRHKVKIQISIHGINCVVKYQHDPSENAIFQGFHDQYPPGIEE